MTSVSCIQIVLCILLCILTFEFGYCRILNKRQHRMLFLAAVARISNSLMTRAIVSGLSFVWKLLDTHLSWEYNVTFTGAAFLLLLVYLVSVFKVYARNSCLNSKCSCFIDVNVFTSPKSINTFISVKLLKQMCQVQNHNVINYLAKPKSVIYNFFCIIIFQICIIFSYKFPIYLVHHQLFSTFQVK